MGAVVVVLPLVSAFMLTWLLSYSCGGWRCSVVAAAVLEAALDRRRRSGTSLAGEGAATVLLEGLPMNKSGCCLTDDVTPSSTTAALDVCWYTAAAALTAAPAPAPVLSFEFMIRTYTHVIEVLCSGVVTLLSRS